MNRRFFSSGKKYTSFSFYLIFLIVAAGGRLIINLVQHQSILYGMEFVLHSFLPILIAYGITAMNLSKKKQFLIVLGITFSLITLQSLIVGSYVDYTSSIIEFIVALFLTGCIMLIIWSIEEERKKR